MARSCFNFMWNECIRNGFLSWNASQHFAQGNLLTLQAIYCSYVLFHTHLKQWQRHHVNVIGLVTMSSASDSFNQNSSNTIPSITGALAGHQENQFRDWGICKQTLTIGPPLHEPISCPYESISCLYESICCSCESTICPYESISCPYESISCPWRDGHQFYFIHFTNKMFLMSGIMCVK